MLSQEENEWLVRVGPGTPAGQLLRRYWHVVGAASELSNEKPKKGVKKVDICEVLRCNWLQAMENSVDPTHTYYLHSHTLKLKGNPDHVPFHYQQLSKIEFELVVEPTWAGIQKQRVFAGDDVPVEAPHPLIFPNILFVPVRMGYAMHFRT